VAIQNTVGDEIFNFEIFMKVVNLWEKKFKAVFKIFSEINNLHYKRIITD